MNLSRSSRKRGSPPVRRILVTPPSIATFTNKNTIFMNDLFKIMLKTIIEKIEEIENSILNNKPKEEK